MTLPATITPYEAAQLAADLVFQTTDHETFLQTYDLTLPELEKLVEHPVVRAEIERCEAVLQSEGAAAGLKMRARLLLERALLKMNETLSADSDVPIAMGDLLKIISSLAELADIAPKIGKNGAQLGASINLNLNFAPQLASLVPASLTIEHDGS